jgi:DNA-binding MarR family transcriptional regulator
MNPSTALAQALQRYMDARNAALLRARRVLKVNEMDARALLFIAESPGTRPSHLRDYLGITSAGVTTLVDRLAERGAVRREVDTEDRRVNRLHVTVDLGAAPWSALRMFDDAFSAAAVSEYPAESSRLAAALDALTASARQALA